MSFFRIVETDELVDVESLHGEMVEIFAETAEDAVYGRDDILAVDEKGFHAGSVVVIVQEAKMIVM